MSERDTIRLVILLQKLQRLLEKELEERDFSDAESLAYSKRRQVDAIHLLISALE